MVLKLYAVSDGPPSLSVRQTLAALQLPHELVSVDYGAGEHLTEGYAQVGAQVLDVVVCLLSPSVSLLSPAPSSAHVVL